MDLFLVTTFYHIASFIEGVKLRIQLLVDECDSRIMSMTQAEAIQRLNEIIDDHRPVIAMVKSLDRINLLTQIVLSSLTLCLVMPNFTLVILLAFTELSLNFQTLAQLSVNYFLLDNIVACFLFATQLEQFVFCRW